MSPTLAEYTLEDLQRLEDERPELGRLEILDGVLHAAGAEMTGDRHQAVAQRVFLALVAACPSGFVVRFDTYWFAERSRLRPDVAVWRHADRPRDGGAFRRPPLACAEVLSRDADHDLVTKAALYERVGVTTLFVDPDVRAGWWCRVDDTECTGREAIWRLAGWPALRFERDELLAP